MKVLLFMPVQVGWDDEGKTTICMAFDERWQWEEVYAATKSAQALMQTVNTTVHVIVNMGKTSLIPPNYPANAQELMQDIPANTGLIVIVSTNPLLRKLTYMISGIRGGLDFEYRFAASLDEARQIIARWTHGGHS